MSYLAAPPRDPKKHYNRGNRESQEKSTAREARSSKRKPGKKPKAKEKNQNSVKTGAETVGQK
jgi:hypothetical protein